MTDAENTLTLDTTKGKVVILMRPDLAPGHVARIKELVRERFYDGVAFHRVIEGFMAQTGCPHGTGRWRGRNPRIPATASFSSVSQTRLFSTANIPSGAR
jgi:peptidylprolyl isomerase